MLRIEIHKNINRIIRFFYRVGFWHRQDEKIFGKLFFSLYYTLFPISIVAGAVSNDIQMEAKILLVESAMMATLLLMKLLYVIWRKREILELLNRICDYRVDNEETFTAVNDKINVFMAFATVLLCSVCLCAASISFIVPFVGKERNLFFQIGFPLDWRNNEFGYWVAFTFISTQMAFSATLVSFSIIIWYLMANCSWRYEALGQQVQRMGQLEEHPMSNTYRDNLYFRDLVDTISKKNTLIE